MINIVKKVYKKIHIIQNIFIKNKFLINKKSYAMEGEDLEIVKILKNIHFYTFCLNNSPKTGVAQATPATPVNTPLYK